MPYYFQREFYHYEPKLPVNVLEGSDCVSWTLKNLVGFEGVEEKNKGVLGDMCLLHAQPHMP